MMAMDFVGPLPLTDSGNKYLLVIADYYTKWCEVVPLKDQKAVTVAQVLMDEVVARHGTPHVLHSDQGKKFDSEVIKELCKLLGIHKVRTTAYHPQAYGLVERLNKTLIDMLAKHVQQNQREWDRWLSKMLFSYRTATQASTGRSPFHLVYGREPRIPLDVHVDTPLPDSQTVVQYVG